MLKIISIFSAFFILASYYYGFRSGEEKQTALNQKKENVMLKQYIETRKEVEANQDAMRLFAREYIKDTAKTKTKIVRIFKEATDYAKINDDRDCLDDKQLQRIQSANRFAVQPAKNTNSTDVKMQRVFNEYYRWIKSRS